MGTEEGGGGAQMKDRGEKKGKEKGNQGLPSGKLIMAEGAAC